MSLKTGRRLSRKHLKRIPITNEVIAIVEGMVQQEGQCPISEGSPIFEWNHNIIIDDAPEDDDQKHDDNVYEYGNTNNTETLWAENIPEQLNETLEEDETLEEEDDPEDEDAPDAHTYQLEESYNPELADDQDNIQIPDAGIAAANTDETNIIVDFVPPAPPDTQYNLRTNRTPDYSYRFGDHQFTQIANMNQHITGFVMTQMTASAGIKNTGTEPLTHYWPNSAN
jgi:hypothetical protein